MNGIEEERQAAAALGAEFGMQVWTDLRARSDQKKHWHARMPGWTALQIISGYDEADLRDRLIMHKRLTDAADSLLDDAAAAGSEPGADPLRSSG